MEVFKSIHDYPNYEVSSLGRVFSKKTNKILNPRQDKDGAYRITLYHDRKPKTMAIHRLVAQAFLENNENLPHVEHIDKDLTNNRMENLRWSKSQENHRKRNEKLSYGNLHGLERRRARAEECATTKKFHCECCNKTFKAKYNLDRHNSSQRHKTQASQNLPA